MKFISTTWSRLSINVKIIASFMVLTLIIVIMVVINIASNSLTSNEVFNTLQSTEIQLLVGEINNELSDARASEANFFAQYPILGITEARETYAIPSVTTISDVISKSSDLSTLIEGNEAISRRIEEDQINLELFLSAAQRNANIFLDAVDTITLLDAPETGLEAQLQVAVDELHVTIQNLDDKLLLDLFFEMHVADRNYLLSRQRPDFQIAFNRATDIRNRLSDTNIAHPIVKDNINEMLDNYIRIANDIIDADVQLNAYFNDFALQSDITDPIAEELVSITDQEVVRATEAIAFTSQLSNQLQVLAAIFAVVMSFLVAYIINNSVTRNVVRLRDTASQLETGNLSARADIASQDELGDLAKAFNSMAQQLQSLIDNLEQRVEERTRDLNIAAQVSQQVTSELDLERLLPDLANLTRDGFDLEHVSVFVLDSATERLVLKAGSGEVGPKMLEQGKHFELTDKGLVPLAARTGMAQIINDVQSSPDHFVNPLLPDTRSEMTIPMQVGPELIGVMDLQSRDVDHFTDETVNVLTALAEQIAIAVRNADLYQQAESARAEAEKSNSVKSQFLASMSHELRTPLNGIMNFTGVVADGMVGPVNEKQQKFLRDAVANAEHLLALINDVLDISKIESGALKLFVQNDINVSEIAHTVARTGDSLIMDKPVSIITEIEDGLPHVVGDKRRIQQILLNIVSNACKFTKEGSITIGLKQNEDDLLLWVKDTGPGIPEEDHEAVFQTFLQTETGLRSGSGTGLGMPISRRLAEAHGGKLWLESVAGEGTTFYVRLPIHSEELQMQIMN